MLAQVGYYRLERLLGEGGMGAVFLGVHGMTGRRVAVKMLRAQFADRADLNARFFNEARTISFLSHPGIVRVYDVGRAPDATAYMVMELCQGPTFGEVLSGDTRLPVKLGLLGAIAEALAHAHAAGVVHRDLKPDNVIVTRGPSGAQPRVLDFGIAKVLEHGLIASSSGDSPWIVKTRTGAAMGTPLYMSPEQCRGVGGVTAATDVYSLGIMLFQALAGRVPFDGGVGEVIVHHLTTPVPPLSATTLTDAHAGLEPLVASMLQKDAAVRPSMVEVAAALAPYAPYRRELHVAPPLLEPDIEVSDELRAATEAGLTIPETPVAMEVASTEPEPDRLPDRRRDRRSAVLWLLAGALPLCVVAIAIALHEPPPVPPPIPVVVDEPQPVVVAPPPTLVPPPKPVPAYVPRPRPKLPPLIPPPRMKRAKRIPGATEH